VSLANKEIVLIERGFLILFEFESLMRQKFSLRMNFRTAFLAELFFTLQTVVKN
jgi:hypothetical protein